MKPVRASDTPPEARTDRIRKRNLIAWEILTTERTYVSALDELLCMYARPLRELVSGGKPILSAKQLDNSFAGVDEIHAVHAEWIDALERWFSGWGKGGAQDLDGIGDVPTDDEEGAHLASERLGHLFVHKLAPSLGEYVKYCRNFSLAERTLQRAKKKSSDFKYFLEMQQDQSGGGGAGADGGGGGGQRPQGQNLASLMINPVQRIPRYVLLLRELRKRTAEGDPDLAKIDLAIAEMDRAAVTVNEAIRDMENREKVREIESRFVGDVELVADGREFLFDGPLRKVCRRATKRFWFFLFNDALVYGERLAGNRYVFHRQFPLRTLRVEPIDGDKPKSGSTTKTAAATGAATSEAAATETETPTTTSTAAAAAAADTGSGSNNNEKNEKNDTATTSEHRFRISTAEKSFVVIAATEAERQKWVGAIRRQVERIAEASATAGSGGDPGDGSSFTAPVWVQDREAKGCLVCTAPFTAIKRRHHCRNCGVLVCGACSAHEMALVEGARPKRVCDNCYFKVEAAEKDAAGSAERDRARLAELDEKFGGKAGLSGNAERRFLRAGPLWKVCRRANKKFWFFLFSDIIVYGEAQAGGKYTYHRTIDLGSARVVECREGEAPAGVRHAFQVLSPQKSFTVFAESESDKVTWMVAVFKAIEELKASGLLKSDAVIAAVWTPDSQAKSCPMCDRKFTLTYRRHHCRICGGLTCQKCSTARVRLPNFAKPVRACTRCSDRLRKGEKTFSSLGDIDAMQAAKLAAAAEAASHGGNGGGDCSGGVGGGGDGGDDDGDDGGDACHGHHAGDGDGIDVDDVDDDDDDDDDSYSDDDDIPGDQLPQQQQEVAVPEPVAAAPGAVPSEAVVTEDLVSQPVAEPVDAFVVVEEGEPEILQQPEEVVVAESGETAAPVQDEPEEQQLPPPPPPMAADVTEGTIEGGGQQEEEGQGEGQGEVDTKESVSGSAPPPPPAEETQPSEPPIPAKPAGLKPVIIGPATTIDKPLPPTPVREK